MLTTYIGTIGNNIVVMDEHIHALEKIVKGREFGELQGVVKTALSCILRISKATQEKLSQHYDLFYDIVSKTEEQNIAIEKQMVKLLNKADHFEEESIIDPRWFLRRDNGLDKIMIEEVKTLAEALIDKRLQEVQQELLTKHDFSIEIRILEQQLDSLKDELSALNSKKVNGDQIEFKMREQKLQLYQELSKSSRHTGGSQLTARDSSKILQVENDIQNIRHSMRNTYSTQNVRAYEELKLNLERKLDKKEFLELKSRTNKQLSSKTSAQEVEAIVNQFQNKVFERINEISESTKQLQSNVVKTIKGELNSYLQQATTRQKRIRQIKKGLEKVEKRMQSQMQTRKQVAEEEYTKLLEEQQSLSSDMKRLETEVKYQLQGALQLINAHLTPSSNQTFNLSTCPKPTSTLKLISTNVDTKNRLVPWQEEEYNLHKQNYLWERNKTTLCIVCPGLYEIKVAVSTMKKVQAQLLVNGEFKVALGNREQQWSHKEGIVAYYMGVMNLAHNSKLSLRVSDERRVDSAIVLTKLV